MEIAADLSCYRVVIFMATYQGEKYLREQLESIINQTFTNWELYVSDDGSSDKTLEILEEYKNRDNRIRKILNNQGEHGAFANFFSLLRYAKQHVHTQYDAYFYCDQDDIWYPDKIWKEVKCIVDYQQNNKQAILCYSDLSLMNGEGRDMGYRLGDISDISLENPYNIFFSERYIWGTTMAHNHMLWEMINIPDTIPGCLSHDNYIGRYAAAFGKILFLSDATVHYRRHGGNVTNGTPHSYTLYQGIKRTFTKLPEVLQNHASTYWAGLYFISHVHNKTKILCDLEQCLLHGGWAAYKFVRQYHINTAPNFFNRSAFFLILYSGIYKHTRVFQKDFHA